MVAHFGVSTEPGGYSPENWIRVRAALKTPFSHSPGHSLRPPFHNFSVSQGPTIAWNHKFLENLHFKASKLGKISVLKPKIWSNFNSKSLIEQKNQFFKTPNLAAVRSLIPYFRPFGPHTHTKMKVEHPPDPWVLHSSFGSTPWVLQKLLCDYTLTCCSQRVAPEISQRQENFAVYFVSLISLYQCNPCAIPYFKENCCFNM